MEGASRAKTVSTVATYPSHQSPLNPVARLESDLINNFEGKYLIYGTLGPGNTRYGNLWTWKEPGSYGRESRVAKEGVIVCPDKRVLGTPGSVEVDRGGPGVQGFCALEQEHLQLGTG